MKSIDQLGIFFQKIYNNNKIKGADACVRPLEKQMKQRTARKQKIFFLLASFAFIELSRLFVIYRLYIYRYVYIVRARLGMSIAYTV